MYVLVSPHIVSGVSTEAKRGRQIPRAGTAGGCEQPHVGARTQTWISSGKSKFSQLLSHLSSPAQSLEDQELSSSLEHKCPGKGLDDFVQLSE